MWDETNKKVKSYYGSGATCIREILLLIRTNLKRSPNKYKNKFQLNAKFDLNDNNN